MTRIPFPEPDHRLEQWTVGDWRMAIGRPRAMGRQNLADALEVHAAPRRREDSTPRRTR